MKNATHPPTLYPSFISRAPAKCYNSPPISIQLRRVGVAEQTVRYDVLGVATCSLAVIIMAGQWTTGTSVTRTSEQPWQSIDRLTVTVDE